MKTLDRWPIKTICAADFPKQLKNIKNCPTKLFYRGNWDSLVFDKSIAVVGSRKMSQYGQWCINKVIPDLVVNKYTVISGFMYGVDTAAHKETVECGGRTVAVLGSGLDVITPIENEKLYWKILDNNGLIISEYENDFVPTLWSFPQRNRIVSGLATDGVVVVEAGIKSGSLITARLAREQGKKLYAIPGPISSSISAGTNYLIKEKQAIVVTSSSDITEHKVRSTQMQFEIVDPLEKKIYELLSIESLTSDDIARKVGQDITMVSQKLTFMNLEGKVVENLGKWVLL